jgi:hypothetical protein
LILRINCRAVDNGSSHVSGDLAKWLQGNVSALVTQRTYPASW